MSQRVCIARPPAPARTSGILLPDVDRDQGVPLGPPPVPPPVVCASSLPLEPPPCIESADGVVLRRVRQVARSVIPLVATREFAVVTGSLAALLFIGCYTGYLVHQFYNSAPDAEGEQTLVARANSETFTPAYLRPSAANLLSSRPANSESSISPPPAAEALFASCRAALVETTASPRSDALAPSWRRGSEQQTPPELPAELVDSSQEQFISIEQLLPTDLDSATCETGQCANATPESHWDTYLGTAIAWESDLPKARRLAREQDKMLFVIGISGNFEDPGFT